MATTKLTTDVEQYLKWAGAEGTTQQQYQEFVRNMYGTLSDVVKITMWQPNTSYPAGAVLVSPDMPVNTLARVAVAGTTGTAIPTWGAAGDTVVDGTVKWTMLRRTIDYATQEEVTAGTNTSKIVTPAMLGKTIKTDLASENTGTLNAADKTVVGGVTGILPVAHGGTGTDSLANVTVGKAGTLDGDAGLWDYLHRKGTNFAPPTGNVALNALGMFISSYNKASIFKNQPGQCGQLVNIPQFRDNAESTQFWIEQASGRLYYRGGNSSIVVNDTPFTRFLDTSDLSSLGVVAGDVSNPDSWWVKIGGTIPIIIQGGMHNNGKNWENDAGAPAYTVSYPVAFPNACFTITGSPERNNNARYAYRTGYHIIWKKESQFRYAIGTEQQGQYFEWVAIGR